MDRSCAGRPLGARPSAIYTHLHPTPPLPAQVLERPFATAGSPRSTCGPGGRLALRRALTTHPRSLLPLYIATTTGTRPRSPSLPASMDALARALAAAVPHADLPSPLPSSYSTRHFSPRRFFLTHRLVVCGHGRHHKRTFSSNQLNSDTLPTIYPPILTRTPTSLPPSLPLPPPPTQATLAYLFYKWLLANAVGLPLAPAQLRPAPPPLPSLPAS